MRVTIPQVQDAVGALCASAVAPVASSVGYPKGGIAKEQVWVSGDNPRVRVTRVLSGGKVREEEGSVEVRIAVSKTGNTYKPSRDRAFELVHQIEDAIADDPTLGGLVRHAWVSEVESEEAIPDERTRQVGVKVTVTWQVTSTRS